MDSSSSKEKPCHSAGNGREVGIGVSAFTRLNAEAIRCPRSMVRSGQGWVSVCRW